MKQTAVEWLYNNLKSHFEHNGDLLEVVQFSFEQAKEMEKEQQGYSEEDLEVAFFEGHNIYGYVTDNIDEAKECFNEWFEQFKKK